MALAYELGIVGLKTCQFTLQFATPFGVGGYLLVQGVDLLTDDRDELLLRLDVLIQERELVHRGLLVLLGLLDHLVGIADLLLQVGAFLLQRLLGVGRREATDREECGE